MTSRNAWLDQTKGVACILIVLHHLAFYGPMADVVRPSAPGLIDWLFEYARMAVQIFLVLGGYWSAAGLAPQGLARHTQLLPLLGKRFVRLVLPFAAALMVTIVLTEVVRSMGFEHRSMSDPPQWSQLLAHLFLLHGVGGWESLSAGVWYVAIDFQLYALTAFWIWLSHWLFNYSLGSNAKKHVGTFVQPKVWPLTITQLGIVVLVALSLLYWNRDSHWDNWAIYFMGAYGLGMFAYWASQNTTAWGRWFWGAMILVIGMGALWLQWRTRIAVAVLTALVLACMNVVPWPKSVAQWRWAPLQYLGQISYSIFLIHFSISLLVNALWQRWWPHHVFMNIIGLLMAAILSVVAGHFLYRWVEIRQPKWLEVFLWQAATMLVGIFAAQNFLDRYVQNLS